MDTKARILEAALRQFNENGTDQTTVRSIAEEVGISHGNLCYHFKNTDALIEALYDRLVAEIDERAQSSLSPDLRVKDMVEQIGLTFRIMYRYRFIFLDFVRIIRRIASVREKFRLLIQFRRTQFQMGYQLLISKGLMREEWEPGLYDSLSTNMLVLGDNWICNAEIHFDEKGEKVIRFYMDAFLAGLVPYFTEKGLEEYRQALTPTSS